MSTSRARDLPAGLERARRRFERWRRTREGRSPIPEALWGAAVALAARYGVSRTATALGVGYYGLKERVEQASAGASRRPEEGGVARFVELAPPAAVGWGECTVEWEDVAGAKLRVSWRGFSASDLAALSRGFWRPGP
jgi:hypothetical protein